jgi:hypothetical protein
MRQACQLLAGEKRSKNNGGGESGWGAWAISAEIARH